MVYVAFLKDVNPEVFPKIGVLLLQFLFDSFAVESVSSLPTQWDPDAKKKISLIESGGDVLIVPQASLAGKIKQKVLQ